MKGICYEEKTVTRKVKLLNKIGVCLFEKINWRREDESGTVTQGD